VILAAEQYASRLVAPSSQQHPPIRWGSHKDQARKALQKLAGPHLPGSLTQLEKAVAKAKAEYEQATRRAARPTVAAAAGDASVDDLDDGATAGELAHEEEDVFEDEDLAEPDEYELAADGLIDVAGAVGPDGAVCSDADLGL
jgi:hypothetical protein